MPLYGYHCTDCGPFDAWSTMNQSDRPGACPCCGSESRREIAMPHLATMNPTLRNALARSEKSGSEPKLAKKKHLAGCGCPLCKMGPKQNTVRKKWSIGH